MMRPQLARFIPGSAALMAWKLETKLIAMIASELSPGNLSIGADVLDAGIVHQDIDLPKRRSASSTMLATSRAFDRSAAE